MPPQAGPLAAVRARLGRVYQKYFSEAQGWLDYIDGIVIERNGDKLIIAAVDEATAPSIRCRWIGRES
jgi:hypothetical protein